MMADRYPENTSPEPTPASPGQPEAMNRSRSARAGIGRDSLTRGEIELDDIHAVQNKQWLLLVTLTVMVCINSVVVFMLLATK